MITLSIIITIVCILIYKNNKKYKDFVIEHSKLLQNVRKINHKYQFLEVENFDMKHSYDNDVYYNKVSPRDYLTYELVYKRKDVESAIDSSLHNCSIIELYKDDIRQIEEYGVFDVEDVLPNKEKLLKYEKEIFNLLVKKPKIYFDIKVTIILTNINGRILEYKKDTFDVTQIIDIIDRLYDKTNGRYNNYDIWNSISIVERAKVSNKMRFAIYQRDGYRCRACGRKTDDLEIDHIMPIAKGGKTEYNNLQTLCRACNMKKSNNVNGNIIDSKYLGTKTCPKCGAPLKRIRGKYGTFYGCINYPKCTYKENIY